MPQPDLERTLNLGVGMVAIVDASIADAALSRLNARGMNSWVMGTVGAITEEAKTAGLDYVQGAKGVDGGAVLMRGNFAG